MGRLIDADDLKTAFPCGETVRTESVRATIDHMPTVDAVEVVHCCECKYAGTDATRCLVCDREGIGLRPFNVYHDDFCSYGERDGDSG